MAVRQTVPVLPALAGLGVVRSASATSIPLQAPVLDARPSSTPPDPRAHEPKRQAAALIAVMTTDVGGDAAALFGRVATCDAVLPATTGLILDTLDTAGEGRTADMLAGRGVELCLHYAKGGLQESRRLAADVPSVDQATLLSSCRRRVDHALERAYSLAERIKTSTKSRLSKAVKIFTLKMRAVRSHSEPASILERTRDALRHAEHKFPAAAPDFRALAAQTIIKHGAAQMEVDRAAALTTFRSVAELVGVDSVTPKARGKLLDAAATSLHAGSVASIEAGAPDYDMFETLVEFEPSVEAMRGVGVALYEYAGRQMAAAPGSAVSLLVGPAERAETPADFLRAREELDAFTGAVIETVNWVDWTEQHALRIERESSGSETVTSVSSASSLSSQCVGGGYARYVELLTVSCAGDAQAQRCAAMLLCNFAEELVTLCESASLHETTLSTIDEAYRQAAVWAVGDPRAQREVADSESKTRMLIAGAGTFEV